MAGWIKLHRKIRSNPIFNEQQLLRLWIICLTEAGYKRREALVGRTFVILQPGEFVTGRYGLQALYNHGLPEKDRASASTVWRWIKRLEANSFVNIKSNNKFSVINVVNWGFYQGTDDKDEQQSEQQSEQQVDTNKKEKKEKNKDKEIVVTAVTTSKIITYEMVDLENAKLLFEMMRENNPRVREPNLQKWADDFRKMRVRTKHPRSDEEIKFFIHWTQNHEFWHTNILSPSKLDKQFDKLFLVAKRESKAGKPTSSTFDAARERFELEEN